MATANEVVLKVLNDLNEKTGLGGVVDKWSDGQGNFWRKYADGWIEQGGIATPAAAEWVTLHIPMATNNYQVSVLADNQLLVGNVRYADGSPFETTRFKPHLWGYDWGQKVATIRWKVCGY